MAESGTKTGILVASIGAVATISATLISIYFSTKPQQPAADKPATQTVETPYTAPAIDTENKPDVNTSTKPAVKTTTPKIIKQPAVAASPDLKEIMLDAKKTTTIPKEYTYIYKQMELYGKWRAATGVPWVGPIGNKKLKLNDMNKWCVVITETNGKKKVLSKEYKGKAILIDTGATYTLRINEEDGKYDDNESNTNNPMRILLRK